MKETDSSKSWRLKPLRPTDVVSGNGQHLMDDFHLTMTVHGRRAYCTLWLPLRRTVISFTRAFPLCPNQVGRSLPFKEFS